MGHYNQRSNQIKLNAFIELYLRCQDYMNPLPQLGCAFKVDVVTLDSLLRFWLTHHNEFGNVCTPGESVYAKNGGFYGEYK